MDNKFEYTYSAARNAEIERIRKKYEPPTSAESKLEQLKKLDGSVEGSAVTAALITGFLGALVSGYGMCCVMLWKELFAVGIIVGIIGMIICGAAYPLYKEVIKDKRRKLAPEILRLSDEIENGIRG